MHNLQFFNKNPQAIEIVKIQAEIFVAFQIFKRNSGSDLIISTSEVNAGKNGMHCLE